MTAARKAREQPAIPMSPFPAWRFRAMDLGARPPTRTRSHEILALLPPELDGWKPAPLPTRGAEAAEAHVGV